MTLVCLHGKARNLSRGCKALNLVVARFGCGQMPPLGTSARRQRSSRARELAFTSSSFGDSACWEEMPAQESSEAAKGTRMVGTSLSRRIGIGQGGLLVSPVCVSGVRESSFVQAAYERG